MQRKDSVMDYDLISPESPTGFSTNKLPAPPIQIYKCTHCGKEEFAENWKYISHYPHCPNCGKMLKSVYVSENQEVKIDLKPKASCPVCRSTDVVTRFEHNQYSNTYSCKVMCCNKDCGLTVHKNIELLDTSFEDIFLCCSELIEEWDSIKPKT